MSANDDAWLFHLFPLFSCNIWWQYTCLTYLNPYNTRNSNTKMLLSCSENFSSKNYIIRWVNDKSGWSGTTNLGLVLMVNRFVVTLLVVPRLVLFLFPVSSFLFHYDTNYVGQKKKDGQVLLLYIIALHLLILFIYKVNYVNACHLRFLMQLVTNF